MKIAIAGGNGFIGSSIVEDFINLDYEIIFLGREELLLPAFELAKIIDGSRVVINLSGETIFSKWTDEYKQALYDSRVEITKKIVDSFEFYKPDTFISASSTWIYDSHSIYSESDNQNYATNFLANICKAWEKEALNADVNRVLIFRFGVVLGKNGGILPKILPVFKMGMGGIAGSGRQKLSWVHIDDVTRAFLSVLDNPNISGIYNLTAPEPTTNKEFVKTLSKYLYRPSIISVPDFILEKLYGEGARVILDGQGAVPNKLLNTGFKFKFHNIEDAIKNLVSKK